MDSVLPPQGVHVRSLVGELRSPHVAWHGPPKKRKKKKEKKKEGKMRKRV